LPEPSPSIPAIDHEAWRARVGADVPAPAIGVEGIAIATLYHLAPPRLAPVPARTPGWAIVQRVEPEHELARQLAELRVGELDALWLDARADGAAHDDALVDAVIAALPAGATAIMDCAQGATRLAARLADAVAVQQVAIDPHRRGNPDDLAEAIALRRAAPRLRTWCCDGTPWHDAGASAVLELAIVIAGALAAVRAAECEGIALPTLVAGLAMRFGLRGDVLVDIAKLRAARALWAGCAARIGVAGHMPIHARSSRRTSSATDVDTNLVHATLEGFAAALGGADTLTIERHDLRGPAASGARRWARNISHVLRGESGLHRIDDPGAGAFAIESLTDALARAAWQRVVAIEASGGLALALAGTALRDELAADALARAEVVR
jgi:methylmalonyl-CoA mutase